MNEEVHDGTGTIQEKTEQTTKKGDLFWKFKIDEKTYSIFEHKAGELVNSGDKVKMIWTETEGTGRHGPITYRNLKSIFKAEEDNTVSTHSAHGDSPKANGGGALSPNVDRRIVRQSCLGYAAKLIAIYESQYKQEKEELRDLKAYGELARILARDLENWVYREGEK